MDFSNLPAPSSYEDWKSWAAMLVQQLQTLSGDTAQNYPLWIEDSSKERSGLPAAADGDVVRVKSEDGTVSLKYWDKESGSWKATADTSGLESQLESQLAEKLDLDLGNLPTSSWNALFNALMPDGSKTIDISSYIATGQFPARSWKAPCPGWIYLGVNNPNNAGMTQSLKQEVFADGSYSSWNTWNMTTYNVAGGNFRQMIFICKGETFGGNWPGTLRTCEFMPCKGAKYGESS